MLLAGGVWGCGHDPKAAAARAEEFGRAAFQAQNLDDAYALLSEPAQEQMSKQDLAATLARMHPQGYPAGLRAVEYEDLAARGAINVYLLGEGTGEMFSYRLTMDGSRLWGYRVGGLFRYLQGFPANAARVPLEAPAS
jgi:hypothetical protein